MLARRTTEQKGRSGAAMAILLAGFTVGSGFAQEQKYAAAEARQAAMVMSIDEAGPFHSNWNSLGGYQIPDWFRDAKFGIFIHWGVYSVPAYGNEWYPRNMYIEGSPTYQHQIAEHGPESKFGYKDFIPMFRGERFDAGRWVDLFARAGAKYIVPVAEHCDGFPMYDSGFTSWDAAKMGPRRDVVGELERASRARGLRFGVSSHRAEHWWWYDGGTRFDSDVHDPRYAGLYGPAQPQTMPGEPVSSKEPDPDHLERWLPPDKAFLTDWLARSTELVDKYHPDFFYFDWWISQPAFQPYLKKFTAYYYNRAAQRKQGVVLTYKEHALPENAAVLDIERGKLDAVRLLAWQTDTSVSVKSWGYVRGDTYRDSASLIDELVDIVSKNGNLLLNVGPQADGTIPVEARKVLLEMGAWLKVNGEAIYGSRPWLVYGEGPTKVPGTGKMGTDQQNFTGADIRYTTHKGSLYAIALGRPQNGKLLLRSLMKSTPYIVGPVCSVQLLGSAQAVRWSQGTDGLSITMVNDSPEEAAYTFRIRTAVAGSCI